MGRPRKTVSIARLIFDVNRKNEDSTCAAAVRQGWNHLLELILMAAGVYCGFGYLSEDEVPIGEQPGIARINEEFRNGNKILGSGEPVFPDETRRTYYVHGSLQAEYRALQRGEGEERLSYADSNPHELRPETA